MTAATPHHGRRPRRPETRPGRWSVVFASIAVAVMVVAPAIVMGRQASSGDDSAMDAVGRALGPALGVALGLSGLGAVIAASFAMFRRHDRSLAVRAAFGYGLLVLLFFIGELATPH